MATQYNYRNFLNQTGDFETEWIISVDNTTGSGSFGISRNNNYSGWQINNAYKSGERVWAEGRIFECTGNTSSYPFCVIGTANNTNTIEVKYYFNVFAGPQHYPLPANKPIFTGLGLDGGNNNFINTISYGSDGPNYWNFSTYDSDDMYSTNYYIPNIQVLSNWKFIANQEEDQKIYEYKLISGEIYDPYGNLLGSYGNNQNFSIKNIFANGKDSLYFNGITKFLFKSSPFLKPHDYNYFYIKPSGLDINSNFYIKGEKSKLNVSLLNPRYRNDNTNETINEIKAVILNDRPDLNVKIFNASIKDPTSYYLSGFPLSFFDSGSFYIYPKSEASRFVTENLVITFSTNFGDTTFNLNADNIYIPSSFSTLSIIPEGGVNITSNSTSDLFVNYGSSSGSYVTIELNYISGVTGFYSGQIIATGYRQDIVSGWVTGSGIIEKLITEPVVLTGVNSYTSQNEIKEVESILIQKFSYATGGVELYYDVYSTGLGTGIVYENVLSTGIAFTQSSGLVSYSAPGLLNFSVYSFKATGDTTDANGNPLKIVGVVPYTEGTTLTTYSGDIDNVFLNANQYESKIFTGKHTGSLDGLEIISDNYITVATGYGIGYPKTGIVDSSFYRFFQAGLYTFSKDVKGISGYTEISSVVDLKTGLEGLLNCKNIGSISYSGIGEIEGTNQISLFIDECSQENPFFYFLSTGKALNEIRLFAKIEGEENTFLEDASIPKFINLKVNENEKPFLHLENINYLTGNNNGQNIRTRISHIGNTSSGSGYFSGIFSEGSCEQSGSGIWEHNFPNAETKIQDYSTNNYLSSFNTRIISSEDTIIDNNNFIGFDIVGNIFYETSKPVVNRYVLILTFPTIPTKNFGDADFNLDVTSTNNSEPITYSSSNTSVATVSSDGTISIVGPGNTNITANQGASNNCFQAASVSRTLTVNKLNQTLTFPTIPTKTFGKFRAVSTGISPSALYPVNYINNAPSEPFNLNVTTNNPNIPITYTISNTTIATVSSNGTVSLLATGSATITATQAENNTYEQAVTSQVLNVGLAEGDTQEIYYFWPNASVGVGSFHPTTFYLKNNQNSNLTITLQGSADDAMFLNTTDQLGTTLNTADAFGPVTRTIVANSTNTFTIRQGSLGGLCGGDITITT
jgi:hypothetical protein